MAKQVPNRFTEWELTEKEAYVATRFTQLNLMLIQTLIAQTANRKVNLKYDAKDPIAFAQQEAEITGELEAYEHLLMLATETQVPEASSENAAADVSRTPSSQPQAQGS